MRKQKGQSMAWVAASSGPSGLSSLSEPQTVGMVVGSRDRHGYLNSQMDVSIWLLVSILFFFLIRGLFLRNVIIDETVLHTRIDHDIRHFNETGWLWVRPDKVRCTGRQHTFGACSFLSDDQSGTTVRGSLCSKWSGRFLIDSKRNKYYRNKLAKWEVVGCNDQPTGRLFFNMNGCGECSLKLAS